METLIGSILDDKYRVLSHLGAGGLGSVYLAEQMDLERKVAIKVLQGASISNEEHLARFEQEAKILSNLQHEHIVNVFNVGYLDSGSPYMAMEYLQGRSLDQLLRAESSLDWQRAVNIAIQICQASAYAHNHGVIHRDLKPQNIMLETSPEADFVKILDFGLSKVVMDGDTLLKLTATGVLIGSIHYMSPELCQGRKADLRSDIYSLGCTLYECLAGTTPMNADHPISVIDKHLNVMPSSFSSLSLPKDKRIPAELELVVFKALQKDPDKRFQNMSEFEQALQLVLQGRGDELRLGEVITGNLAPSKNYKMSMIIAVMIGLLLVAGLCVPLLRRQTAEKELPKNIRAIQQDKARDYLAQAEKFKAAGKIHQAKNMARRAFMTVAQEFQPVYCTTAAATEDLAILSEIAALFKDLKTPDPYPGDAPFDAILKNDKAILQPSQMTEYYLLLSQISGFYGNTRRSRERFLDAAKLAEKSKSPEECLKVLPLERAYGGADRTDANALRDITLDTAEAYLCLAQDDRKGAEKFVGRVEKHFKEIDEDLVAAIDKFAPRMELARLEVYLKQYDKAEANYRAAKKYGDEIRAGHNEAPLNAAQELAKLLRIRNRNAEADAVLKAEDAAQKGEPLPTVQRTSMEILKKAIDK